MAVPLSLFDAGQSLNPSVIKGPHKDCAHSVQRRAEPQPLGTGALSFGGFLSSTSSVVGVLLAPLQTHPADLPKPPRLASVVGSV